MSTAKKVFVTGCYDMLHSGHVAFFQEAARYGELYVGLGSDETVFGLKGRYPIVNQEERKYIVDSLKYVRASVINSGTGIIDFVEEIEAIKPDIFIVNEDGNTQAKEDLCRSLGIEYIVLKRTPHAGLPLRSTTALREECTIPYRVDLAGGWLDQPFVGQYASGPVITISIEPTLEFNERSGMASSTRRKAIELWHTDIPAGEREQLARILFSYENPPGTRVIAGSQDALGIVMPGLNRLDYEGEYWPAQVTTVCDEEVLSWIEQHLCLVTLGPRESDFDVLDSTCVNRQHAAALSHAARDCWAAILDRDLGQFGAAMTSACAAQLSMFPNMADEEIFRVVRRYEPRACGWKLSGAGGGGYLIFVAEEPIEGAIQIKIRRPS